MNENFFHQNTSVTPAAFGPQQFKALLTSPPATPDRPADFGQVCRDLNQSALDHLVEVLEVLLDLEIKVAGDEIRMINPLRADDNFGSFSINSSTGAFADFAEPGDPKAKGSDVVALVAYVKGCTQGEAARHLSGFMNGLDKAKTGKAQAGQDKTKANAGTLGFGATPEPTGRLSTSPCSAVSPAIPGERIPPCHHKLAGSGAPTATYIYKDLAGAPVFAVHRYDNGAGKEYRPYSLTRSLDTKVLNWQVGLPKATRPLYNLDKLAAKPKAIVVFCEGEKAADAAAILFPEMVATTTMGGAMSAAKTDFSPLAGRNLIIAPDNDPPGRAYKDEVVQLASKAGAARIKLFQYPKDLFGQELAGVRQEVRPGYDLADVLADGWTKALLTPHAKALFADQAATVEPAIATAPQGSLPPMHQVGGKEPLVAIAQRLVDTTFGGRLLHDGSGFRTYRNGYWPALNLTVDVEKPAMDFLGITATPAKVSELVSTLAIKHACLSEDFERPKALICLCNGTLDPVTGTMQDHSPDHCLPNRLDISWDPEAQCVLWLQTLDQIFAPDTDKAAKIQLLQEWFGYCLIADTSMHKFVWMVGGGGNGKSLVLAVFQDLLGRQNVSHAQIERLQDKFVRAELHNKLANISSEMSASATIADGYLKQIVSGDTIEAERKFQASFSFKPVVRLIGATNELPRLLDHSDGFFRRAIILNFNRRFSEAEQDRSLETRVKQELPGILAWAVQGLRTLRSRGSFSIPPSSVQVLAEYRTDSNPVQQFADEVLERTANRDEWVSAATLHEAYTDWATRSRFGSMSTATFRRRLEALQFENVKTNAGRFWKVRVRNTTSFVSMFGDRTPVIELPAPVVHQYHL
jgi:putative DNA primase/helicase